MNQLWKCAYCILYMYRDGGTVGIYMYVLYTGMYMYIHVNKNVIIPCCTVHTLYMYMYVDYQITHNLHNTLRTYTLYVLHTVLTHT